MTGVRQMPQVFMLLLAAILAGLVLAPARPLQTQQPPAPANPLPALQQTIAADSFTAVVLLGRGDRSERDWSGEVSISGGQIEALDGDRIRARAGRDRLIGRAGDDCLFGGRGSDVVFAAGGGRDQVFCGLGRDRAVIDARDSARGCEILRRR